MDPIEYRFARGLRQRDMGRNIFITLSGTCTCLVSLRFVSFRFDFRFPEDISSCGNRFPRLIVTPTRTTDKGRRVKSTEGFQFPWSPYLCPSEIENYKITFVTDALVHTHSLARSHLKSKTRHT